MPFKDKVTKAAYDKAYYLAHKAEILAYDKARYSSKRDELVLKRRAYYKANKDKVKAYQKTYIAANKDKIATYKRRYYQANKTEIEEKKKQHRVAHRGKYQARDKAYLEKNRDRNAARSKAWYDERKADPAFKKKRIREHYKYASKRKKFDAAYRLLVDVGYKIFRVLDGRSKDVRTIKLIGCDKSEYLRYLMKPYPHNTFFELRKQGYQIHHIIPCSSYSENPSAKQLAKVFHYANTQLIPGEINNRLGDRPIRYNIEQNNFSVLLSNGEFSSELNLEEAKFLANKKLGASSPVAI